VTTETDRSTDTWRTITELIVEMAPIRPESWSANTHLINELGYDSVTAVGLVFEVERVFETGPAPDDIALSVETVGALADCLTEHVTGSRG
jgi:acyl carrier protein